MRFASFFGTHVLGPVLFISRAVPVHPELKLSSKTAVYYKAPMTTPGAHPEHDLFRQQHVLEQTLLGLRR